jgi:nitroreductase
MNKNEVLLTIEQLRSTHGNFSNREVSEEDFQSIIKTCVRAANASARQSYSIIALRDKERIKQLCGYNGSKALLFCVDFNRIKAVADHLGRETENGGIHNFIAGSTDTILAAQTAAICARSIGIDFLFTNGIHRGDMERVYNMLHLPEKYCFPLIMLVFGYAAEEPKYLKGRYLGPGLLHDEKYHACSEQELEDMIAYYDDPKIKMGMITDWKKLGFEHYYDWFFKKWIGEPGELQKSQMLAMLEKSGFLDW